MKRHDEIAALLRCLGELDELEGRVSVTGGAKPPRREGGPRRSQPLGVVARVHHGGAADPLDLGSRHRRLEYRWASIAAAALLSASVLWFCTRGVVRPQPQVATIAQAAPALKIQHVSSVAGQAGLRTEIFELTATEDCDVFVLLRGWDSGCQCLHWQLPDAQSVASKDLLMRTLVRNETAQFEIDVSGDPPIEQLLVAVSIPRSADGRLDRCQLVETIQCLDAVDPASQWLVDIPRHLSSVPACLPGGLEWACQSFVAH
ncbi:MAG: hypothetical protein ACKVX7_19855 [Planctomycetota bacterium]